MSTEGKERSPKLLSQKFGDGFGAGADLKFFINPADIGVDGLVTDAKFFGDLFVEKTLAEAIEDFLFALGKIFSGLRRGAGSLKGLGDFAGDVSGHGRTAAMNFANGFQQFGALGALEKVAVGAGGEGAEDIIGVFVDGEHDDLESRDKLFQLAHAFDAVDAREIDVHENNFRPDFRNVLDGIFGVAVMTEAFEAVGAI